MTDEALLALWHAHQAQAWTGNIIAGFEQILNFPVWEFNAGHAILGALLLSAGIPWLLTGLFLRSDPASPLPQDDDAGMETA